MSTVQWGRVDISNQYKNLHHFNYPLPITTYIVGLSFAESGSDSTGGDLVWHCIGTHTKSKISVTINSYNGRSPVVALGYFLIAK